MMRPQRPLVLVVDNDSAARARLTNLLSAEGYAVETFDSATKFLERSPANEPSCLVLELIIPGIDGLALQLQLAASGRREEIIFVTGSGTIPLGIQAMKQGAVDFLTKPFDQEALLTAVAEALLRSAKNLQLRGESAQVLARLATLTPREFEVFRLVIAGLLNKQIAAELGAAVQTIKIHRGRVMHKLSVRSVAQLVRLAEIADIRPAPPQR